MPAMFRTRSNSLESTSSSCVSSSEAASDVGLKDADLSDFLEDEDSEYTVELEIAQYHTDTNLLDSLSDYPREMSTFHTTMLGSPRDSLETSEDELSGLETTSMEI